jgi:hypothetical protein
MLEVWDLWFPQAGATGISFARARVDGVVAGNRILVHAAPPHLDVMVRGENGHIIDEGYGLERTAEGPMSYLVREGGGWISLQDGWPMAEDIGRLVILPGGEAGILMSWWHAEDHSEWRWQVELSNHV